MAAVLTLGLGIGGASAMFSVVDAVLIRRLPYPAPDRLVNVWTTYPHWRGLENLDAFWDRIPLSYPEFTEWRDGVTAFDAVAAYARRPVTLTGGGTAEQLTAGIATASLPSVLGVTPALGRWFLPGEAAKGVRLAVLGDGLWRRRFGADRSVLGRTITLDDESYAIIGVLPPGVRLKSAWGTGDRGVRDVWLPIGIASGVADRGNHAFDVLGRLRPGVTLQSALGESRSLLRFGQPAERRGARMALRRDIEVGSLRAPVLLLFGAAGVLLAIASVNVALMLLGESVRRRHEMATRVALGASQGRLVRQLLTEAMILGLGGAIAGALIALLLTTLAAGIGPARLFPTGMAFQVRVFLFAGFVGTGTGILFGLAPVAALRVSGLRPGMEGGSRGSPRGERALHGGLIIVELALTMLLLVTGGLLSRSLFNLSSVDPGFAVDHIAVLETSRSTARFSPERLRNAYRRAVQNLAAVPGVAAAGAVNTLPLLGGSSSTSLSIEGVPAAEGDTPGPEAERRVVFPDYLALLQIPVLAGRGLSASDDADAPPVMLVSERFARVYFQGSTAVGRRVRHDRRWWTVVGVVGDVRHEGLATEPVPTYYVPHAQEPLGGMTLLAKTAVEPTSLLPALRAAVWAADPDIAIPATHTLRAVVSDAAADQRYRAAVVMLFAVTAALLSCVGVFGATARSVERRRSEMGLRMAMGASAVGLSGMVVRGALTTGAVGVSLGILGSAWSTRFLAGFLFGVARWDLVTWAAVAAMLLAVTIGASYLAARRIGRLDPVDVLKAP